MRSIAMACAVSSLAFATWAAEPTDGGIAEASAPDHGPLVQRIHFSFQMTREEQGVTPEFRAELGKVDQLIKEKDFAGAHFHAQWMLRERVRFNYEYAVLQALLAQTLAL